MKEIKTMTTYQFKKEENSFIHIPNMLRNLDYAFKVKDKHFINAWFPVFFPPEQEESEVIKSKWKKGKITISENDTHVEVSYK